MLWMLLGRGGLILRLPLYNRRIQRLQDPDDEESVLFFTNVVIFSIVKTIQISGADSGSDRETTSSSESEQEDAFHSLLTELNGKVVKHNKRSFKGSDEDEESQSDADSDEDLAEEQVHFH